MPLHRSKGLESPVVFTAGMEEGLFPHSRAADIDEEVEEERRLCYVGMTRARQLLYLTNTLSSELYDVSRESGQSRFVREVDSALIRRIAPERNSSPVRPLSREPYVDFTDSQLPDDEPPSKGDGLGIGARVIHPIFGRGVVRKREGRGDSAKAWVNFDRSGIKQLVLKFANLTIYAPREGPSVLGGGRWLGVPAKEIPNAKARMVGGAPPAGRQIILPDEHILPETPHVGIVLNIPEMRLYYYFPSPTGPIHHKGKVPPLKSSVTPAKFVTGKKHAHVKESGPSVVSPFPVGLARFD